MRVKIYAKDRTILTLTIGRAEDHFVLTQFYHELLNYVGRIAGMITVDESDQWYSAAINSHEWARIGDIENFYKTMGEPMRVKALGSDGEIFMDIYR